MAIECNKCKAANPDGKRFCGDCGASLVSAPATTPDNTEFVRREQVMDVVRQHYKDQKVVEIETTQAIATRLSEWTKLLAFFVGLPVAALFFLLGFFGIKTYTDFSAQVKSAEEEISQRLKKAKDGADELKTKGDALAKDYERLQAQLAGTDALAKRVNVLTARVDAIGEKIGFTSTSQVSADTKSRLSAEFERYKEYLQARGYKGKDATIEVDITDKIEGDMLASYDPAKQRASIMTRYVGEAGLLLREYTHHVLFSSGRLAPPGTDGWTYSTIESAIAWYLPCSFLNDPVPARNATVWDLTRKRSFSELRASRQADVWDGTEIWASAFWEIRQKIGREAFDQLLLDVWFKLRPDDFRSLGVNLARKLIELGPAHRTQIQDVFVTRGLRL